MLYFRPVILQRRVGYLPLLATLAFLLGGVLALGRVLRRDEPVAPPPAGLADARRQAASRGSEGAGPSGLADVPSAAAQTRYTIRFGDTLTTVAARFGTTVEALMEQNGLRNADAIFVGQELLVHDPPQRDGPTTAVLPDSAFVRGPASLDFDPESWLSRNRGRLSRHREIVDGAPMSGPAIVARVSREFSVDARVLLAFVDARSGWVGGEAAVSDTPDYAAGLEDPARASLWHQLNWLADRLNGGFYDWKTRDNRVLTLGDGVRLAGSVRLNAGSFAVQRALGLQSTEAELEPRLAAFAESYRALFGDPFIDALPSLVHADIEFPELGLPWSKREAWWFTGGPHGGWGDGSAWAAVDFVAPGEQRGCFLSPAWARAVADGVIVEGGEGELWLDLDGDARRETGPVVLYLHLAEEGRAEPGTRVRAGDPVGHPSCEGGFSTATHLHLARLYDGEWLAAGGVVPLTLGGWRAEGSPRAYDGRLVQEGERVREACECRLEGHNDVPR